MTTITATRDSTQDIQKQIDDNTLYNTAGNIYLGNTLLANRGDSFNLFDFKWTDYELNDQSWLRADTFSWQNGTVYTNAYNHLVDDVGELELYYFWYPSYWTKSATPSIGDMTYTTAGYDMVPSGFTVEEVISETVIRVDGDTQTRRTTGDKIISENATQQTETVGSYTITYLLAQDGHKICLPDQETTVQNIYNESGVAWYYILDTTNQRFKLPRTKYGFTGYRDSVGKYVPESLPNLTSGNQSIALISNPTNASLTAGPFIETNRDGYGGLSSYNYRHYFKFDASNASSTYQNNAPVQQRATQMYLYFYVGQFSQSATEQTAGVVTETLNGKLDADRIQFVNALPANPVSGTLYLIPE